MRTRLILAAGACFAIIPSAKAMDFTLDAYADFRILAPSGEVGWIDGGLGKFRFGADQPSPNVRFVEAVAQATLAVTDDLHLVSVVRVEPEQRTGIDVLEAYATWRPESSNDWRWSVKAGAFFPTVSVENDDLGWTSPYTLTPSAINSWIGDELRTIGGEGTLARQTRVGTLSAVAAIFCCNEPAGTLIADRGWTLDDRPTALFERVRLPDATVNLFGGTAPGRTGLFQNIDGDIGWYAGLRWDIPDLGQLAVLRYDNRANPFAYTTRDAAWLTRFWSGSLKTRVWGATVLVQALTGDTSIGDEEGDLFRTYFDSAFALVSYDIGDWRMSGRAETFETRNVPSFTLFDEDGRAFTAALLWNARDWLRLSAELINIDSRRTERLLVGSPAERSETQFQFGARVLL